FFGLGDQIIYPQHFVDGLGTFEEEFLKRGAKIIGRCPVEGYDFTYSEGMSGDHFFGLAIDEDSQSELTDQRIQNWWELLKTEL
ncbi:MAG: flavodoxin, partial [Bacteroidales bacterium]|nr:flavodoxin [Bacteroidales bacterium]